MFCPEEANWVERVWYTSLIARNSDCSQFMNSGHLILSRELFDEIGGFDASYETAEDVKLCADAIKLDAMIYKASSIVAVHHGYAKSIRQFYYRERWHAIGMIKRLRHFWRARDASLAMYNLALISLVFPIASLYLDNILLGATITIIMIIAPLVSLAVFRARRLVDVPLMVILFIVYGAAKSSVVLAYFLKQRPGEIPHWK